MAFVLLRLKSIKDVFVINIVAIEQAPIIPILLLERSYVLNDDESFSLIPLAFAIASSSSSMLLPSQKRC